MGEKAGGLDRVVTLDSLLEDELHRRKSARDAAQGK
jgi:hypothetical protein